MPLAARAVPAGSLAVLACEHPAALFGRVAVVP
jgi:hypothetical protein